eukprot:TRINITY_DN1770_c0_g1_i1.p2 TRINITY_DN1770_c0_g1~~TRINITY_DN1770_c0_g1_i1.p2  ORF type:complete len:495 (+),score=227.11 TRINITY_DN1770_c0_g1_i1:57-1541(+)
MNRSGSGASRSGSASRPRRVPHPSVYRGASQQQAADAQAHPAAPSGSVRGGSPPQGAVELPKGGEAVGMRAHMKELQLDYAQMKDAEAEARQEIGKLRAAVDGKDEEVRKLKIHVLQLRDFIDSAALQSEEEKNDLRQQLEQEGRSYRQRNTNMSQLLSQLRQDAVDSKAREGQLQADADGLTRTNEELCDKVGQYEKLNYNLEREVEAAAQKIADLATQKTMWSESEKSWLERVRRAETLVLDMEKETGQLHRENEALRHQLDKASVDAEEYKTQVLQGQRRETEVRSALSDAQTATETLISLRRENSELLIREREQSELIDELRMEKQKMMSHLQQGIRERQHIIDSLTHGDMPSGVAPAVQLKVIEIEALKAELHSCSTKYEEEARTAQEFIQVLTAKSEASEERVQVLRNDNRRLRAELELSKAQVDDVYAERNRAKEIREELEQHLQQVAGLRNELLAEKQKQETLFREHIQSARGQSADPASPLAGSP